MTDSRNILIDVVFAKDSLTKISSADMREFVNYVYNEHMNKDNIADNLTTQSSTVTLSAKQGVELDRKIENHTTELSNLQNDLTVHDNKIDAINHAGQANTQAIGINLQEITTNKNDINNIKATTSKLANDIISHDARINQADGEILNLREDLDQTDGIYDRISDNEKEITTIINKLGKDDVDLSTIVRDIKVNTDAITEINTQDIPDITARITNLLSQANQEMSRIDKKTDSFRADIDNNEARINSTNSAVIAAQAAISNQNLNFTKINQDISSIEGNVSNILQWESSIRTSEKQIQHALSEINDTKNLADNNKLRLDNSDQKHKVQDAKIQVIQTDTNTNTIRSSDNEKAVLLLQTTNNTIQSKMGLLSADHVRMGTNITKLLNGKGTTDSTLIDLSKKIDNNSKFINDNKILINDGFQTMTLVQGDITTIQNTAVALDTKVKAIKTEQDVQKTEINDSNIKISKLESGTFTFPGLVSKEVNDQLILETKIGTGQNVSIQAKDGNTDVWSIGSVANKPFDNLEINSKAITLKTENLTDLKVEARDPNNQSKLKTFHFLAFDDSLTKNINDGDMIWYKNNEWDILPQTDVLTKLDVFNKQETHDEIDTFWNLNIGDFKNNYLDTNYYKKGETYTKHEVDDALLHQVGNTTLSDYGTAFGISTPEYKAWEKLRTYSPQTAPGDETEIPDITTAITTIAEAEAEIRRSRTEIIELQRKMNLLLTALKMSGVLI